MQDFPPSQLPLIQKISCAGQTQPISTLQLFSQHTGHMHQPTGAFGLCPQSYITNTIYCSLSLHQIYSWGITLMKWKKIKYRPDGIYIDCDLSGKSSWRYNPRLQLCIVAVREKYMLRLIIRRFGSMQFPPSPLEVLLRPAEAMCP